MMLIVVTLILASCNYITQGRAVGEMSLKDEQRLVALARSFILNNKKIVTVAERLYIQNNAPTVRAVYDGYKTGKTTISWDTGKRRIVARLYGAMTGENHKWRLTIYFKEEIICTPSSKVPTTPIPQISVKDFAQMFREQAVMPDKKPSAAKNK